MSTVGNMGQALSIKNQLLHSLHTYYILLFVKLWTAYPFINQMH